MKNVSNGADILDSRDIIKRIEELESERETIVDQNDDTSCLAGEGLTVAEWDEGDEGAELKALRALAEEGEGCSDWNYGETLIRDSYFETYARDLAEDIGAIGRDDKWPATCIDWEQAARELQYDYTSVDFDGVTYWIRS